VVQIFDIGASRPSHPPIARKQDGARHSFYTCHVDRVRENLFQCEEAAYLARANLQEDIVEATECLKVWWDEEIIQQRGEGASEIHSK
jgi:hypothetical protein